VKRLILALALLFSCIGSGAAQLGQYPQFVSILPNGAMNAFGCVFTYSSGTSSALATYTDYTLTTQNPNPTPLSAGGVANIWYQGGLLYRVVIKSAGGTNCSAGTTILTVDGVNSSLLNTANTWDASQTFDATTYFALSDLQLVFGSSGSQTTLDIPPPSGNYVLHGPSITGNDTLLSANAAQTVENKNLTTGTEVNGCGMVNSPGTYVCMPNNSGTATIQGGLAVLVAGTPATVAGATTSQSTGIVGICVAGCGITGTATIQQSGTVGCNMDSTTVTSGDYIIASSTTATDCTDSGFAPSDIVGANFTNPTQILGQALYTSVGGVPQLVNLFSPSQYGIVSGGTPSYTLGVGAGTGATAAFVAGSRTKWGAITVTTGSSPTLGPIVTIQNSSSTSVLFCAISPVNGPASAASSINFLGAGSVYLEIYAGVSALNATTAYEWAYVCDGQ
jgi:hypothetical protein